MCEMRDAGRAHEVGGVRDEQPRTQETYLGHALVDVLVDDLVDLPAQLVGDLGLLLLHHRAHKRDNVLAASRPSVGHVQVVQRHILHHLLLLVHVALGQRDVLLGLQIILRRKRVRAAKALEGITVRKARVGGGGVRRERKREEETGLDWTPTSSHANLDGAAVLLDVDDVADLNVLLLHALVDGRVELELLGALGRLQANDDMRHSLGIAWSAGSVTWDVE